MKEINLAERLCLNFCPYYKPVKNNELACMGFLILERLIKKGKEISFEKSDKKLYAATERTLIQHMCIKCSFYESDCDFVSNTLSPTPGKGGTVGMRNKVAFPPPCGGFMLLGYLLETSVISIDDINNID
jgi:hypothetical protein